MISKRISYCDSLPGTNSLTFYYVRRINLMNIDGKNDVFWRMRWKTNGKEWMCMNQHERNRLSHFSFFSSPQTIHKEKTFLQRSSSTCALLICLPFSIHTKIFKRKKKIAISQICMQKAYIIAFIRGEKED